MQMQPTKMQTSASNHSGCKSGVKHTWGRLYKVMQVHISPNLVSPSSENKKLLEGYTNHLSSFTSDVGDDPIGHGQTYDREDIRGQE